MSAAVQIADASILIVAFNSRDYWPRLRAALEAQSVQPREIFVLDNGSKPGHALTPEDMPAHIQLEVSADNLGFAGGNNRLAAKAETEWLVLLNPDAFPDASWLEELMAAAQRHPHADLFGSTQRADGADGVLDGAGDVYHITGFPYRGGYGRKMATPEEGEIFAPCGAAMMIRRSVFEALGGFDEDYFCYVEDVDLGARARLAGHIAIHAKRAVVSHVGYGSSARRSDFATYHGTRNRWWTYLKVMPLPLLILTFPLHLGLTMLLWASSARFGQFGLFSKAQRDAFAGWGQMMTKRRQVQRSRKVSAAQFAAMLAMNPLSLFTRAPHVRPVDGGGA